MSASVEQLVERAWRALWREGSPYHLPTAFQHGRLSGHIRVRPLASLPLPNVSDVVLFDRKPWGGVTLSLRDSRLEGLNSAAGGGCAFDPATGTITAGLRFPGLRVAGSHVLRSGHRTGAALSAALVALGSGDAATDDANIALSKTYRDQLVNGNTDSGRMMVSTYYENNDTYSELFQLPTFVKVWAQHTTAGQTTQFYANQTSNAAQPQNAGTVPVNGTPDAQGNSPYNAHSFYMQNLVISTCFKAAGYYKTSTELGKRYEKAGSDATTFGGPAKTQSGTSQTVNQVVTTVSNTPPPSSRDIKTVEEDPQWLKDIREKAQAMGAEIVQKDLVEGGIDAAARARPVQGVFSAPVPEVDLTLVGRISPDGPGGAPTVTFLSLEGPVVEIELAISGADNALQGEVGGALARARFLKRLLGYRTASALTSATMLEYLSRQMNLALAERLGATG